MLAQYEYEILIAIVGAVVGYVAISIHYWEKKQSLINTKEIGMEFRGSVEYQPSTQPKEVAMMQAEMQAFHKAIPKLRGRVFKRLEVKTTAQHLPDYSDVAIARCLVVLEEDK